MSIKSRENWGINMCLKTDCINRDKWCKDCIRFSHYQTKCPVDTGGICNKGLACDGCPDNKDINENKSS